MKKMIIMGYLICLTCWDMREKKLPVWLLALGSGCGLVGVSVFIWMGQGSWQWEMLSICLAVLPGVLLIVLAKLTQKAGLGDGWTLLNVGMFETYKTCLFLLGISLMIMAVFSAVLLLLRKATKNTKIPYIPFLALAYLCRLLL
ncbi:MAG: hypothetical protein IJ794_01415 [Lachnospiraceae bacterium]|nr:hypothetical protein [Lachnospiraceae bacterium]